MNQQKANFYRLIILRTQEQDRDASDFCFLNFNIFVRSQFDLHFFFPLAMTTFMGSTSIFSHTFSRT